jgi:hypothetical protein
MPPDKYCADCPHCVALGLRRRETLCVHRLSVVYGPARYRTCLEMRKGPLCGPDAKLMPS